MTIEIALIISITSVTFGVIGVVSNLRSKSKSEATSEATQLTTVIVKLENIGKDVSEMKTDLRDVKDDIRNHGERLVTVEQQIRVLNNAVFKEG